jgi:single-strand DNA-binding protein
MIIKQQKKGNKMSNPTVTMTGRVGTEPEVINYSGGKGIKFRMVTSDRVKNKNGEWEDRDTSWWNVEAWSRIAEQSQNVLKKGQEITVVGTVREESYVDKSGNNKFVTQIKANNISVSVYSLQKTLVGSAPIQGNAWDSDGDY